MIMAKVHLEKRGSDAQGSGEFGAPRGTRKHNGIDYKAQPGDVILSPVAGKVTKLGYPYDPKDAKKGHLRYVQVSAVDGLDHRLFYIAPCVAIGDRVEVGDPVGVSQDLRPVYPGITPHVHYEVKKGAEFINPESLA